MRQIRLYRYQIPFTAQQIWRGKPVATRDGLIFCLIENGKQGWGEVAPLPFFSRETLPDAEIQLIGWLKGWQKGNTSGENLLPSVAFGVSCALWELENRLQPEMKAEAVPLLFGTNVPQGITLAKVKIALDQPETEGERINQLLAENPDLRLRLDANRQWSLEQAVKFGQKITDFHRLQIDFFEEPCRTPAESLAFADKTGIAIAWDETTREAAFRLENKVAAVVLKPMLLGSLDHCVAWIEQAKQQGIKAVISSSLESSLGLTKLARFAYQFTPDTPAGLDTLRLLRYQLQRPWHGADLPLIQIETGGKILQEIPV